MSKFIASDNIDSVPAVSGGMVYVGESEGSISGLFYALNATTLAPVWINQTHSNMDSSPAVANGVVYVTTDDSGSQLYAWNASTGAPVWAFPLNTYGMESSPAVANGVVYVGTHNGFYAVGNEPVTQISVTINPRSVSLDAGQGMKFTAGVTGTANNAVTWNASAGSRPRKR